MTVTDIKNIERKDVPIYYRRVYSGIAAIEVAGKEQKLCINWTIETSPWGTKELSVTISDKIDYPLIPLIRELKAKIGRLDEEGKLPL
ncbi:MAG: hypothetical protein LBV68_07775 [Spirochaetaceae bacterium]|jgi:hypothetical protein|nr:hypothetical protein [Spirochaetaceae bacterium]